MLNGVSFRVKHIVTIKKQYKTVIYLFLLFYDKERTCIALIV